MVKRTNMTLCGGYVSEIGVNKVWTKDRGWRRWGSYMSFDRGIDPARIREFKCC
jgi:hypothetical protein